VRESFLFLKKEDARRKLNVGSEPLVVSYWGSLGAREMNKRIAGFMLCEAKEALFRHIHATGTFGWRWMPQYVKDLGLDLDSCPLIDMREYIYDMPLVMSAADLVICRGGASTIGELCAAAMPAVIVPGARAPRRGDRSHRKGMHRRGAV
jgi:UDP-N-acetylglucosamine--N-acetylmuramyl-(pentapeptide) pyrophosphoryl-undecaprenol N-acetylglucosamine transferase